MTKHKISNILFNKLKPYIILLIATFIIVLLKYFVGIRYSVDSNWYLLFSDWIAHFNTFDRKAVYPPLYYLSLGLLQFIGFSTIGSILIYWWMAYFTLSIIFFSILRNITISIIAIISILSNATVLELFRYVWTELGYSVLLVSAVYALYKILKNNNNTQINYKIIFLLSIAFLPIERYIGAYLSIYLGLIYLFHHNTYIWKRLLELTFSTIPFVFVILWNILLTGSISGKRGTAIYTFLENLELSKNVILNNFLPEWILLIIATILFITISLKKRKFNFFLFLLFIPFIQVFFQVLSSSIYHFDTINSRFFIVTTPTIVLLLLLLLKELFHNKKKLFNILSIFLFILLILFNFLQKKPMLKHEDDTSFIKIRSFLTSLQDVNTVGLFVRGRQYAGAEFILTSKIIPPTHCQKYLSVGNFRNWEISYLPNCENLMGYTYIPLKLADRKKLNTIIISNDHLEKGWQKMFSDYKIVKLGLFYGLTKNKIEK